MKMDEKNLASCFIKQDISKDILPVSKSEKNLPLKDQIKLFFENRGWVDRGIYCSPPPRSDATGSS
jgi:hypothetical protein